jgi:enoyl-CoA hydratase/carnithine racemase
MTQNILVSDESGIRTIRMNRPEKKNALTLAMYDAMTDALESASADAAVRCVLFTGTPGAYTAGNDLADFLAASQGAGRWSAQALRFLPGLVHCRKPLVAAVTGVAVGIGTTMLLHCDYVVVGSDARFSTPFVALGLVPEAASTLLAPRMMGQRRAFELLVMGQVFDAAQAKACGIANTVVAPEHVEAAGMKAAREIASLPPGAVAAARELMRGTDDELTARMALESKILDDRLLAAETKIALEAFFARKR